MKIIKYKTSWLNSIIILILSQSINGLLIPEEESSKYIQKIEPIFSYAKEKLSGFLFDKNNNFA